MNVRSLQSRRQGFTLLEMLLVVVFIGLLTSIGGGFYQGTYKRMVVEKSARELFLATKYARVVAIERRRPCRLEFSEANNGYALVYDSIDETSGESVQMAVRDTLFRPVVLPDGVRFEAIEIDASGAGIGFEDDSEEQQAVVFSPMGTSQRAVIQIGDGKNHYTVTISAATGKPKMSAGVLQDVKFTTIDLDEEDEEFRGI